MTDCEHYHCVFYLQIFDWLPEPYDNASLPGELADMWSDQNNLEYNIYVKCEGEVSFNGFTLT